MHSGTRIKEVHIDDIVDYCGIAFEGASSNPAFDDATKLYLGGELLTELVIPEGVKRIHDYAFCYNDDVVSVSFPSTLESVGTYAFYECSSVSSLYIPDSVTEIDAYAFCFMGKLESVYFGSGVRYVGEGAFYNWNVAEVKIADLSAFLNVEFADASSNPLYNGSRLYLGEEELTEIVVPEEVTKIGKNAFYRCKSIRSLTLHDKVTEIGEQAFYNNCELKAAVLSGDGLVIGKGAFYNCYALESVILADGVECIGDSAFYSCTKLSDVSISSSVTSIEGWAFYNCGLHSLTVPSSVTEIGKDVFASCSYLKLFVKVGSRAHIYAKETYVPFNLYDYTVGDVDCDGELTNADITLAVRAAVGWDVGYGSDTADINFDGRISNRELIFLIQKLAWGIDE